MTPFLPVFRTLVLPAFATGIFAMAGAHAAEQPASAPAASKPPSAAEAERRKKMGGYHPDRMKNPNLTGNPPRLTITPPDQIPLKDIKMPSGFHVELWAHGMPGARMMARAENGTVFVGTRTIGRVYAVTDKDGTRTSKILAEKLVQPNGVLFHNGSLYVAAINKVLRYDNIEANLEKIPAPVDMTDAFKLPPDVHHNWKFLAFGPDNKIYIPVGSPCNVCEVNPGVHGHILATTSTAPAWRSSRAACATVSASISTRRRASSGSPTMAVTGPARKASKRS